MEAGQGMRKQRPPNFSKSDLRRLAKTFPPPLCRYYFAGHCPNGDACPFSHVAAGQNMPAATSTITCVPQPMAASCTAIAPENVVPVPGMAPVAPAAEAQHVLKRRSCWDDVTHEACIKRARLSGLPQSAHRFDRAQAQLWAQAQVHAQARPQVHARAQLQI